MARIPPPLLDLAAALMLLTRIPVPWARLSDGPPDANRSLWAYPLVGALVALIGGLVFVAAHASGVPVAVAVVLTLAAQILATGAFHEDGLADVADGFGGGVDKIRKLEIMKDSRIGTYGALAVLLALAARGTSLYEIPPVYVGAALLAAGALSRFAIVALLAITPPARPEGLGAAAGKPDPLRLTIAAILAFACTTPLGATAAVIAVAAATAVALFGTAWIARRQVGGYTGDVLGTVQQLSEVAILITLASLLAGTG